MFLLREPSDVFVRHFLAEQAELGFSYSEVGATREGRAPAGYVVDHNRVRLGEGERVFSAACGALRRWEMFRIGWIRLLWPDTAIETGATVGVLVRAFGLWSLNACRVVYLVDEEQPARRLGFAYGTLPDHGERGEERFTIEWRRDDDSVWYDIFAFSRPQQLLTRIGYPLARRLQKRFAESSKRAMARAVAD